MSHPSISIDSIRRRPITKSQSASRGRRRRRAELKRSAVDGLAESTFKRLATGRLASAGSRNSRIVRAIRLDELQLRNARHVRLLAAHGLNEERHSHDRG